MAPAVVTASGTGLLSWRADFRCLSVAVSQRVSPLATHDGRFEPHLITVTIMAVATSLLLLMDGLRKYRRTNWFDGPPLQFHAGVVVTCVSWIGLLTSFSLTVALGARQNAHAASFQTIGCFVQGAPVIIFLYAHRSQGATWLRLWHTLLPAPEHSHHFVASCIIRWGLDGAAGCAPRVMVLQRSRGPR